MRPRTLAEAPPVLGPRHQFPLGSPAFPLFLYYETTTGEKPPEAKKNLQVFECPTEAANSHHCPYFANWRVKLQTSPTPMSSLIKNSPDLHQLQYFWQKWGGHVHAPQCTICGDASDTVSLIFSCMPIFKKKLTKTLTVAAVLSTKWPSQNEPAVPSGF